MNKKFISIIAINLLIFLVIFYIAEYFCYKSIFVSDAFTLPDYKKFNKVKEEFVVDKHLYTNYERPSEKNRLAFENDGRSSVGREYKNKPILLLGCSYTYGLGLTKEETFGYQLSQFTKRPVYNWGWKTESADYSFLQLKQKINTDKLAKNPPQYVIYTYMYDHLDRLISKNRQYRWYYLRQYGLLKGQHFNPADNLYTVLSFKNKMYENILLKGNKYENLLDLDIEIIKAMKKEVEKYAPESKFVILLYSDSYDVMQKNKKAVPYEEYNTLNSPKWKALQKQGFIVVSTEELLGRKMDKKSDLLENDYTLTLHPTTKIWQKIVIKLSEKLAL